MCGESQKKPRARVQAHMAICFKLQYARMPVGIFKKRRFKYFFGNH